MSTNCPFCGQKGKELTSGSIPDTDIYSIGKLCESCGEYCYVYDIVIPQSSQIKPGDKPRIAAILRERQLNKNEGKIVIADSDDTKFLLLKLKQPSSLVPIMTIKEIVDLFPKLITDRLDRVLLNLAQYSSRSHFGMTLNFMDAEDQPFFLAENEEEMKEIITALKEMGYIKKIDTATENIGAYSFKLTVEGYKHIYELSKINPTSRQGFVAMWFDPSMDNAYREGIKKAIKDRAGKIKNEMPKYLWD